MKTEKQTIDAPIFPGYSFSHYGVPKEGEYVYNGDRGIGLYKAGKLFKCDYFIYRKVEDAPEVVLPCKSKMAEECRLFQNLTKSKEPVEEPDDNLREMVEEWYADSDGHQNDRYLYIALLAIVEQLGKTQ